ncbi:MFS transporter [Ktedonosporobacter rubrisoli]|nr:MFS transporter [Ktedonosporobacter rubrisoli]
MKANLQQEELRRLRLARIAIVVFFFTNGLIAASMSARLPTIQIKLALSPGQLGLALLGCTVGGLLAMNIGGRIARRSGSHSVVTIAAIVMCITLPLLAFAPNLWLLLMALIGLGAGSGAMDVTMNMQAAELERAYGRPILSSFHACFSIGSLLGATLGSLLAALHISPELHFLAVAGVTVMSIIGSSRFLLVEAERQEDTAQVGRKASSLRFSPTLVMLGLIAFSALLSVGAMFDWSAVYLSDTLHAEPGLAAAGFSTFLVCMTLGRAVGDYLTARLGAAMLVRSACSLAALGLALALLVPWVPLAFLGLGLVGIGLSVPFPLVISAAGRLSKKHGGSILVNITTWGYFGMIAGPAVIGFVADRLGLRLALGLVALLCVMAALCASAVADSPIKAVDEGSLLS